MEVTEGGGGQKGSNNQNEKVNPPASGHCLQMHVQAALLLASKQGGKHCTALKRGQH
jgi:hypothetical protein